MEIKWSQPKNQRHKSSDFSDVQRLCNKRMHHHWKTEMQEQQKQDTVFTKLAIMNSNQDRNEIARVKEVEKEAAL